MMTSIRPEVGTTVLRIRRAVAALAAAALLTACTGEASDEDPSGGPGATSPAAPAPTGTPGTTAVDLAAGEEVATGIDVPWGVTFLPDDSALVAERDTGRVLQVPAGGGQHRPVYEMPGVNPTGEGGLLGLAVSPEYAEDRWVYAYLTTGEDNRIVRFRLDGGEPEVVFAGIARAGIHNGGRIAFGPDGMLYAGTGDAADPGRSQDPADPAGKILRMTPDGRPAPGNPTDGSVVYSLGHRNVQGFAWHSDGRMFGIEFGQNEWDEVNLIEPGNNYGWPEVEGDGDTRGGRFTNPVITWTTAEASPSGAAVVGDTLFVAALRGQRLWTVPVGDGQVGEPRAEFEGQYGRLRTVTAAPDGSLWVTTSNTDRDAALRDDDDRILRFPPA